MSFVTQEVTVAIDDIEAEFGAGNAQQQSNDTDIKKLAQEVDLAVATVSSIFASPTPIFTGKQVDAINAMNSQLFLLTLLVRDIFSLMPDWLSNVYTTAETNIPSIGGGDQALVDASLQNQITDINNTINGLIINDIQPLLAYAQQSQAAINATNGNLNLEIANRTAVINAVLADLNNSVAYLQGQINALAVAPAPSTLPQAEAYTDAKVNVVENEVKAVGTQLTTGLSQITNVAIPAASAAATAAAVAQLSPAINALKTETDTCLAPLCDTVTPNASNLGKLGNIIKGLEGLVAGGLLAGLLTAAVEDPKGTATLVVDSTGWMSSLATELAGAVGGAVLSVG